MAEVIASSPEDIFSEILRIFAEIPGEILAGVDNEWISRSE
jgi:hypothetical protein